MKYVALLRGINVGGNNRVEMKKLKTVFESMGFENVSTYINSGNVLFEGLGSTNEIRQKAESKLKDEFGFSIPALIKTHDEVTKIAKAIPKNWTNDTEQKTDVAFLFPEIDSPKTIEELPLEKEFVDVRYVDGAIFWNVKRENLSKSRLNKLVGHKLYKYMTVRNVNTVRYLDDL